MKNWIENCTFVGMTKENVMFFFPVWGCGRLTQIFVRLLNFSVCVSFIASSTTQTEFWVFVFLKIFTGMDSNENLIKNEFVKLSALTEQTIQSKSASLHCNRHKNRYCDVLPNEDTQVKLSFLEGITGSDYINANFVRGETSSSSCFICGQAPLPQTFDDFWRMIWEQVLKLLTEIYKSIFLWINFRNISKQYRKFVSDEIQWIRFDLMQNIPVIVVLMRLTENGRIKGHMYWPGTLEETKSFGNINVTLKKAFYYKTV